MTQPKNSLKSTSKTAFRFTNRNNAPSFNETTTTGATTTSIPTLSQGCPPTQNTSTATGFAGFNK